MLKIFLTAIFVFILDIMTNKCIKRLRLNNILTLLIHHLISATFILGWTIDNGLFITLYLLSFAGLFIYWKYNSNTCHLTTSINKTCDTIEDNKFHDIPYFLGLKSSKYLTLIYGCYLVFCIYMICRRYKKDIYTVYELIV